MSETLHTYENGAALAEALADAVSARLAAAIAAHGKASIAVSGGSTPKAFFRALAGRDLDWTKVTITLVDERFVPPESDRSNHALVASNLLQDKAAAAKFVPLYHAAATAEAAAAIASEVTAAIAAPFDVVVLGMGTDGHTASFFPGGTRLEEALDPATPRGVVTMEADGAGEPRLTFTFSSLRDAGYLVLHIEGEGKKEVLARAQAAGEEAEMPIRAMLRRAASPLQIYWAP
ncbi:MULTISPECIES: 6-phosphogluconolactonase [Sinorhizobium]|uniref:6-phosphogluconolactonase n=2 Tax=Sinorhizobium TaxID=28105 RepID=A0A2S3YU20_9HYPH|nr:MULTISPECIES: 6-phosphogluconolactonase [Sinorhizobium]ASY55322.1 6-phosphogluconolactonase, eukaryotic type [Sinorhizobium sp. CCBAU 05631]AUX75293.1 6-phosphogluconolactonase [Sinorhizobium fredii]PDT38849.1 6-phosphogluconolactonase [Sinorhizobium sp. FG01]PDT51069.1 6-phosphogluconolactonase [Sinorhizobium sp. NG07B]POH25434.1 6-phosphogluconolactonase [Sinorhizobium americanum]